jgi:hypothetical protein
MSGSKDPHPTVIDSTPDGSTDDTSEQMAFRSHAKAPPPVEPHWESVIAAATD